MNEDDFAFIFKCYFCCMKLIRTDAKNSDFITLVKALDLGLRVTDGDLNDYYHQFNGLENIKHCCVVYIEDQAAGCGTIKAYDATTFEVKRMYVGPKFRGRGIASKILDELEKWAAELGADKCILETGLRQVEALGLYKKQGYKIIENYDQYAGLENSVCFGKEL